MALLQPVLRDFMWHREPFQLRVWVPTDAPSTTTASSAAAADGKSSDGGTDADAADADTAFHPLAPRPTAIVARPARCAHLFGRTSVGDCIDDEWFIVHLLRECTRARADLSVGVRDADGQFLLIEVRKNGVVLVNAAHWGVGFTGWLWDAAECWCLSLANHKIC
jgi:hypothetical protein